MTWRGRVSTGSKDLSNNDRCSAWLRRGVGGLLACKELKAEEGCCINRLVPAKREEEARRTGTWTKEPGSRSRRGGGVYSESARTGGDS